MLGVTVDPIPLDPCTLPSHAVCGTHPPILQEEKEEIRRMNQMILHSKCMAARDLQVAEKATAHVQAAEEERRVVEEMEARRKAALAELEVGACRACALVVGRHDVVVAHEHRSGCVMPGRQAQLLTSLSASVYEQPQLHPLPHLPWPPPAGRRSVSGSARWSRRRAP